MVKYPHTYNKLKELADIPESEWLHLEQFFTPMTFKKGDHIVRAGDTSENMYFILSGLTRSYYIDQEGKEFNKIFLAEGEVACAYVEILMGVPARLNIQALEKVEALAINFKHVHDMYERHQCWNEVGRKIAEQFFIIKEQREYEFLLLEAKDRYQNFITDYGHIVDRIPQYHIAAYLGITPVSLSRIINASKDS